MNKRIKYICYYGKTDAEVERNYVLSASNKLEYIWRVLNRAGYDVDVISASNCIDSVFQYVHGSIESLDGRNTLRFFPGIGGPKVFQVLGRYWLWICFFFWFLSHVQKGEKIIVYHSLGYCRLLTWLKRLTGCYLIGEIEEIYQDVSPQKRSVCLAEYRFIHNCDAYVFPTHLLNEKLNLSGKPFVFVHGIYEVETPRGVHWEDSDIHVVYAGTFDPNKGGVSAAIASAKYLPKGYHLHICGFGCMKDIINTRQFINKTNTSSAAVISYDGLLRGEEFIQFLQKCQIGLSCQNPSAAFNETSFPSKLLTYLGNGLKVVSVRIPAVEFSGIGNCISYYNEQVPQQITQAIINCEKTRVPVTDIMNRLDKEFKTGLESLLRR